MSRRPATRWPTTGRGRLRVPDELPVACLVGSNTDANIVSCSPSAAAADIRWPKPDRITVLCGRDPWDKTLHRNMSNAPVTPVPAAV